MILRYAIACVATAVSAAQPALTPRQQAEDFEAAWQAIDRHYAYFDGRRAAWKRARATWKPRAMRAATRDEFIASLEHALDTLHDDHVSLSERSTRSPRRVPADTDIWARWRDGAAVVEAVRAFGDADVAGLKPGYRVTAVGADPVAKAVGAALGGARGTPEERDWALRHVLAGPRSGPLRVEAADGSARRSYEIERTPAARANGPAILARRIGEHRDLGYVRLRNGLGDPALAGQFAGTLGYLRDTRALILDLRDATGSGSRDVTRAILGHFVTAASPWQLRGDGRGARSSDTVEPNGGSPYRAPLVVLVDRWTAGEGEALAAGLAAVARARLVGTPMAGLRGELREVALPHSGIVLRFPGERTFHVDGTPREKLRPHVEVDLAAPSGGPGDPILYQALKLFEG